MNRLFWIVATIGVVAIAISAGWLVLFRDDANDETYVVQHGSIDVTVSTTGVIAADPLTTIHSMVFGFVAEVGAEVGDEVAEGDILVRLNPAPFERNLQAAERALTDAEFNLQAAELTAAENPDDPARQFEVSAAQFRMETAQIEVEEARQQLTDAVILAPDSGVVLEMLIAEGAAVTTGQPVAAMYSSDDIQLIVEIDELDLPNVQTGAEVHFRLDAFPAVEIDGVVTKTSPAAVETAGVTLFSATVEFTPPADVDIRPGMNADVTVVTDNRENVLIVPEQAIRSLGDRSFVTVIESGTATDREISVGHRGGGWVEVVSGLAEGDELRVPAT